MTTFTSSRVRSPFQPTSVQPEGRSVTRAFEGALRLADRCLAALMDWYEVARQRRALRGMSDVGLKDIGVSRADAMREAGRRFWDVARTR